MYLQRVLLAIWFFGLLGLCTELVFLEHYEDAPQFIPFAVIALGLLAGGWYGLRPGAASLRAFRATLVALGLTGLVGVVLHYRGNAEFERERDPTIGGIRLVWESLTGATPALSPGTLVLFAFIGYALLVSRRASGS